VLIDLSAVGKRVVERFKTDDDALLPLGDTQYRLSKIIADLQIDTVITDSCSAFSQLATDQAVTIVKGATIENPSPGGYGARNIYTLRMMGGILRTTKKSNTNCIFITHEDDSGVKDKEGNLLHITMLIGGKLGAQTSLQISEVWHLADDGTKRKIMVRPGRMRKPMKTRMFDASSKYEFELKYDQYGPEAPYGKHSIAQFIKEWQDNGRNKIQVP
jgi:predicted extracellular nuclease